MLHIVKRNNLSFRNLLSPLTANIFIKTVHNTDSNRIQNECSTDTDVLDSFTTQLLQKKTDKWWNLRIKKKIVTSQYSVVNSTDINFKKSKTDSVVDICSFDTKDLNELIIENAQQVNSELINKITTQFLEYKICPTGSALRNVLSFYAVKGDREMIKRLQIFVEEHNKNEFLLNAKFLHYLAEAIWFKGNISDSLQLFQEVFDDYVFLRRKLKLMLKYMIINVISSKSEATLVLIINFAQQIAEKYDDYFLLSCVWQVCFLSEWYADQCRATQLLEDNEKLSFHIVNRIHFIVNTSIKIHQVETVHRLLELLLKYNMKSYIAFVLQSLFNYRCKFT